MAFIGRRPVGLRRSSAPLSSDISCPTTGADPDTRSQASVDAPRTSGAYDRGIIASRASGSRAASAHAPLSQSSPWRTAHGEISRQDDTDCAAAGHLPALPRMRRGHAVARREDSTRNICVRVLFGRCHWIAFTRLALQVSGRRRAPASRCGPSPHPAPSSATFAPYLCGQPCRDAPAVVFGSMVAGFTGCPARLMEKPRRPMLPPPAA